MEHSYYGRMGPRFPNNFGVHFMDDLFKRILDKHEKELIEAQNKLLEGFQRRLNEKLDGLNKNITKINGDIEKIRNNICDIKPKSKKEMKLVKV